MDHVRIVQQNRDALQATVDFGVRALGAPQWEATAGSEAAVEMANTELGPGGPWGAERLISAYSMADLMMTGVLDNLACLRQILDDKMAVIGPTVVARSTIEIASTAWWLMEPRIGARRRVCRELVVSLTSARRAGQVARSMQATGYHTSTPEVRCAAREALQGESQILQRITDLGIGAPTGRPYEPIIEGETTGSATDATGALLRAVIPANAPPDLVYRTYSAITHGELYGLLTFMEPSDSNMLRWHLPPQLLDSTVQLALAAFSQAYRRIRKVMGWGMLPGDLWDAKVRRIYHGTSSAG
jgi:hypothetical protein